MQFEKIQVSQTSAIQWSVLANESSFHTPFREPVEHNASTPLNQIQDRWTFPDILFADKLLLGSKCFPISKKVWYHNKMNETLKTWKSKLSPSFTLSSPLGNKLPNLPSAKLPPARITESDKVSQDFSVGISQRTSETHLLRGRASTAQQGRGWLD